MADSSVLLEVIVEGKNIKLVQREVEELGAAVNRTSMSQEKAAESTKKTTEAQDDQSKSGKQLYNNQRAIINGSLSQGRANSKLASGISGTLVPAYAEIASRIFAISAAFGVLQRAQALEILKNNLETTGAAAGRNLAFVADGLRDITDGALSARDALQATANATAQGFSTTQLEGLTRVAKGASAALGRDLTDSLDRLVRGTAKLEPEILDELGIIVRLDDATREYAASIGKSVGDLTQFERQQAFLNATLEQGAKKFGELSESTDTNPYSRLAASFTDLTQTLVTFANTVITPVVNFFANNKIALTGALLLFAKTIFDRISPALDELRENSKAVLKDLADLADSAGAQLKTQISKSVEGIASSTAKLPKAFKDLRSSILDGTATTGELEAAVQSLTRSEDARYRNLEKFSGRDRVLKEAEIGDIVALREEVQNLLGARQELEGNQFRLFNFQAEIATAEVLDEALTNIGEATTPLSVLRATTDGIGNSFSNLGDQIGNLTGTLGEANTGANKTTRALNLGRFASSAFSVSLRSLGASALIAGQGLLAIIPFIGPLLIGVQLLTAAFGVFFKESASSKAANEVAESFSSINKTARELAKTTADLDISPSEKSIKELDAVIGILDSVSSGIEKVKAASAEEASEKGFFGLALSTNEQLLNVTERRKMLQENLAKARERGDKSAIQSLEYQIELSDQAIAGLKEKIGLGKDEALTIVNGLLVQLDLNKQLNEVLGERRATLERIKSVLEDGDSTAADREREIKILDRITNSDKARRASLEGIQENYKNILNASREFGEQEDTAVTKQIRNYKALGNEIQAAVTDPFKEGRDLSLLDPKEIQKFKTLGKILTKELNIKDTFEEDDLAGPILAAVKQATRLEDSIRASKAEAERLNAVAKSFGDSQKTNASIVRQVFALQNQGLDTLIKAKEDENRLAAATQASSLASAQETQRLAQKELSDKTAILQKAKQGADAEAAQADVTAARQALTQANLAVSQQEASIKTTQAKNEAEILALQQKKTDQADLNLAVAQAEVAAAKRLLDLQMQVNAASSKEIAIEDQKKRAALELSRARANSGLTAEDELRLIQRANKEKIKAEEDRLDLELQGIGLQYKLLAAQAAFEKAKLRNIVAQETEVKFVYENGGVDIREVVSEVGQAAQTGLDALNEYEGSLTDAESVAKRLARAQSGGTVASLQNAEALAEVRKNQEAIAIAAQASATTQERIGILSSEEIGFGQEMVAIKEQQSALLRDIAMLEEGSAARNQKINELEQSRNQELELRLDLVQNVAKADLDYQQSAVSALKQQVTLTQQIADVERQIASELGMPEGIFERFEREKEEREARIAVAEAEAQIKKSIIDAEYNLLEAKAKLLESELKKDGVTPEEQAIITANNTILDRQRSLNDIVKANIDKEVQLIKRQEELEQIKSRKEAVAEGGLGASIAGIVDLFSKPEEKEKTELDKQLEAVLGENTKTLDNQTEALSKIQIESSTKVAKAVDAQAAQAKSMFDESKAATESAMTVKETQHAELINAIMMLADKICACTSGVPSPGGSGTATGDSAIDSAFGGVLKDEGFTDEEIKAAKFDPEKGDTFLASAEENGAFEDFPTTSAETANNEATSPTIDVPVDAPADAPSMDMMPTGSEIPESAEGEASGPSAMVASLTQARAVAGMFAEDLKKLGPEGEAIAGVVQGAETMLGGFAKLAEGGQGLSGTLEAVGSVIAGIGQMQAASTQKAINSIDKQIAAEKKRDGKSKESQAKIAALEKKKEALEKKKFNQQKKAQMAQIIINTAAGIAKAVSESPMTGGMPGSAIAAAVGAAQLAIVASQKYEGGGSSAPSAPSKPTSISAGERSNKVDLATSQSAGGELAYLRGERGIGGSGNFRRTGPAPTPAFEGATYRAMGGATTGYMVGEQGPELFIPEVPGTILSEPETEAALAPATNVTFNVNAIDAQGVEEVLMGQRGSIIEMLRESANSYGQTFFEEVDTEIYRPADGASRA